MVNKIALEEHFLDPSTVDYWWPTMVDVARAKRTISTPALPISAPAGWR